MKTQIRIPAVAGSFYPADRSELVESIRTLLGQSHCTQAQKPRAIIAPHAGYIYSGPIAASAYQCLANYRDQYKTVILLGPSHRVALRGMALSHADFFATPLGDIPIDQTLNRKLQTLPQVDYLDEAHLYEHSLEVHLPFLQSILGAFQLVPIVVGDASPEQVAGVLDSLASDPTCLIVVSTDLSHFLDYGSAQQRDKRTAEHILDLDYTHIDYHDACGRDPLSGVLLWARRHQLDIQLLDLRNSGDTAGSHDRVVGYASFMIS